MNFLTYHTPLVHSHRYQWFPNSWHVIHHNGDLNIQEADTTNQVPVYSGPFDNTFVYPWPNGSRLIIRTNFNQGDVVPVNLYTINLKGPPTSGGVPPYAWRGCSRQEQLAYLR